MGPPTRDGVNSLQPAPKPDHTVRRDYDVQTNISNRSLAYVHHESRFEVDSQAISHGDEFFCTNIKAEAKG